MTPRTVIGLGAVTLVAVIAAVVIVAGNTVTGSDPVEAPVFDGLEDNINSAAAVVVRDADGTVTVQRNADGWEVAEREGYPADVDMVRKALFELSQLRLIEPKTRLPERYARIEVRDVDADGAKSALLTVMNESGDVLAELIVGKAKQGLAGIAGKGVYVRKSGDEQSWLARGELDLRRGVTAWLAKDVVDIAADRIQRVTTTQPGGAVMVFNKDDPTAESFAVKGLPKDKSAKPDEVQAVAGVLSGLRLNDVVPAAQRELPEGETVHAEVATFDGLVIDIRIEKTGDDEVWASFEASAASEDAEVVKQVEAINARVSGWVYQVPASKLEPLLKKPEDLVAS